MGDLEREQSKAIFARAKKYIGQVYDALDFAYGRDLLKFVLESYNPEELDNGNLKRWLTSFMRADIDEIEVPGSIYVPEFIFDKMMLNLKDAMEDHYDNMFQAVQMAWDREREAEE